MATTVDETDLYRSHGERGLVTITGTVTNTAAETTATLIPGANDTNVAGSVGARRILRWGFTDQTAVAGVQVVKSYNSTEDKDQLALTFTAGSELDWWIEAQDMGA